MRLAKVIAVAVCAAALLVPALSFAQAPAGSGGGRAPGGRRNRISMVTIPLAALTVGLTLTGDQQSKIKAIQDQYKSDSKGLRPAPGTPPDPANREKMRDLNAKATSDINAILTTDQQAKVGPLMKNLGTLIMAGIPAEVYGDLKLTDDQQTKIADVVQTNLTGVREQLQGLDPDQRRAKQQEIMQGVHTKAMAVLTDDQKMVVEDYEKAHPRRQRGAAAA